ncbi:hypothetical protein N7462_001566 [Penicillium macrosclerotiorum]|uniref:uncharacterized protein n=1 Tax=Penicillium macrosclerotiorum TaxID=303699 RepID=UPI0025489054|nr:uncharacterized protein N7462_001566 [Penicillium macrosclerotiorum]KAJ5692143.1 hypothetical protein N7462_001566 [Penicillium macrosclerotiorum]
MLTRFLIRSAQDADGHWTAQIAACKDFDSNLNVFVCRYRLGRPREPMCDGQFVCFGADETVVTISCRAELLAAHTASTVPHIYVGCQLSFPRTEPLILLPSVGLAKTENGSRLGGLEIQLEMQAGYEDWLRVQSLVVSPERQRQGLGRQPMDKGLQRAQQDVAPVGLEASLGEQF